MTTRREGEFIDAYEKLTARLAQALGVLGALNTLYSTNKVAASEHHPLSAGILRDALSGVTAMLDEADTAAVCGLGGCKFVERGG
jgi:hypothetical protein